MTTSPDHASAKAELIAEVAEQLVAGSLDPENMGLIVQGFAESIINALDERGVLALFPEWDVEYRDSDGIVSRHTVDVVDEVELSREQAEQYAKEYNSLDPAPGKAAIIRRYVSEFHEVGQGG